MRRRKNLSVVAMLQVGIGVVLFLLLVLFICWYGDGLSSYEPEGITFYYQAGVRMEQNAGTKYKQSKDVILVEGESGEQSIDTVPILFSEENKMLLSTNYLVMTPKQGNACRRVNAFTTVLEKNGLITFRQEKKSTSLMGGFLYDGDNTYVFLEPMTMVIGAKEINLEPLSYVRVLYRQTVEYYNSADDTHELIYTGDMDIEATNDEYTLDLGRDVIHTPTGEYLIFHAVDDLEVISMEK